MLDLFLANSESEIQASRLRPAVSLGGSTYWFLHRYFVQASLAPGDFSFLNLYEDTELSGYQLHRLSSELKEALVDLSARPSTFAVLVGWNGETRCAEAEDWKNVERAEVERVTKQLLELVHEATSKKQLIFAVGD
jgi:hypothetical protein